MSTKEKYSKLKSILKKINKAVIAFSGGVDSVFLAKTAKKVLGNDVLAVTVDSSFLSKDEKKNAIDMARLIGIRHSIMRLSHPDILSRNPKDRCYICKRSIFSSLKAFAKRRGYAFVLDGSNLDDLKDIRPGKRALFELGVRSPLQEAGLTKKEIRILSKKERLKCWNRPSFSCLATRIPYGEELTSKKLKTVEKAEDFMKGLEFRVNRIRLHSDICRIEVPDYSFKKLLAKSGIVVKKMRSLGIKYICLDLQGYRSGSMDDRLKWKKKR